VKVFVVRNHTLGQIKWEQLMFLGNPEYGCELQPIDFAAFARACGGHGFSVKSPTHIGDLIQEALNTPGPVILEADVDPLEAPMFANMQPEQAKKLREAFAKGQPDAEGILENARKERARELV
jgi:pyruvate dehydrogenase (quinone)